MPSEAATLYFHKGSRITYPNTVVIDKRIFCNGNIEGDKTLGLLQPIGEMMSLAHPFCTGYIYFIISKELVFMF